MKYNLYETVERDFPEELEDLSSYISCIESLPDLRKKEDNQKLLRKMQKNHQKARNQLIEGSLAKTLKNVLDISMKKNYQGKLEDLIGIANLKLVESTENADPDEKQFRPYIYRTILDRIETYLKSNDGPIEIPSKWHKTEKRIREFIEKFENNYGSVPSEEEIVENVGGEKTKEILRVNNVTPFHTIQKEDYDALTSEPKQLERISRKELKEKMGNVLRRLDYKEKEVLQMRYGIGMRRKKTLKEIGKIFDLTHERVRQIERKAIQKLKNPKKSRELETFFYE